MTRIRLLATSDVHGSIYPHFYGDNSHRAWGLACLKTLIDSLKDDHTILIDNGDTLEGTPLSFYHYKNDPKEISPMTKAMKACGYDFINLGNHDFNYGEDALFAHLSYLDAPCISANVFYKGYRLNTPYTLIEKGGVKIALFAVTTQHIPFWEKPENITNFRFEDAFETAKAITKQIREETDAQYIVCAYHGGFERSLTTGEPNQELTGENEGYQILSEIDGIDVLISGHQHRSLCGRAFGKVYTQTASSGTEIACIDIDENGIEAKILKAPEEADQSILDLCKEEEEACQKWLDQPLGTSRVSLKVTDEADARLHKSQLITFLNKVQTEVTGADLSASALFLGATGFDETITMRNIVSTYVFPNTLTLKKVTGAQLKAYLEKDAEFWSESEGKIIVNPAYDYPTPMHYNYDMLDGCEYTIKVSNPVGSRITELKVSGEDIKDEDTFTLAVNNYRASGGGDFNMIREAPTVREDLASMVDILADYIMEHKVIDFEEVHNIRVIL